MLSIPMPPAPAPARTGARRWARWFGVVAVSVLIHLAALDALPHWTIDATDDRTEHEPLRATLMPIVPAGATQEAAPPPAVSKPAPPKPRPAPARRAAEPVTEPAFTPEPFEPPQQLTVPPRTPASPPVAQDPPPAPTPVATAAAPPMPPTSPPRSARLDYQVISQKVKEANPIYGKGTITWTFADGRYGADAKAAAHVAFFTFDLLSSHSEGAVGPAGLAPDRYTEAPRFRATVATNFNRDDRQSITFSASQASAPLAPGAQDRLSVLFQIGALLLADPLKTAAGTAIEIPVAGVRGEVEQWRFDVRGPETLDTGVGALSTTHLVKAARPGTTDRTIDVWVAQSDGGYPARVLYTEPSGNTVMMTLDRISAVEPGH